MVFSHLGKENYRCTHANTLLSHPFQSGPLRNRLHMASLASRKTTALRATPLGTWAHLPLPRRAFRFQSKHTSQTQIPLPPGSLSRHTPTPISKATSSPSSLVHTAMALRRGLHWSVLMTTGSGHSHAFPLAQ